MITIINEKHDQAQDFAKALGGQTGRLPSDSTLGNAEYQIGEAAGHLLCFKPLKKMVPEDQVNDFTSWDYNDLPFDHTALSWQKMLNPDTVGYGAAHYMKQFQKMLSQSSAAIIATDNDPSGEGDLLGWEIIDYCNFTGDVYRIENFETNILEAMKHLRKVTRQDGLLRRAKARQKFDYLTIQYVRIATDEARKKEVLPNDALIGEGRLQSTMVQLVGNQEQLHNSFVPHSTFQPALFDIAGHHFLRKDAPFYKTKAEAQKHLDSLPQNTTIIEQDKRKGAIKPPKMYTLSKVAAKLEKDGYNPKTVQKLAESMYTAKYLSYPRTEDDKITSEHLENIKPFIPQIASLVGVDLNKIDVNNFRKYLIDDSGKTTHGANRPSFKKVPKSLDEIEDEFGKTGVALYTELAKSFLAEFAPDKIVEHHYYADSATGQYKATATITLDKGWSDIRQEDTNPNKEKENDKLLKVGDALRGDIYEKKATRPALATSDSLSTFFEHFGIGTGATRLDTYNKLTNSENKKRQMIQAKRGKLTLTKLGTISYLLMGGTALAEFKMTKRLEDYLVDIQKGKITEAQILDFCDKLIRHDKDIMLKNEPKLDVLEKIKTNSHKKVKGIYKPTGKEVQISDGYSDHTFTQTELDTLFNGGTIKFTFKGTTPIAGKLMDRGKYGFGFQGDIIYPAKPEATGIYTPTGKEITFVKEFPQGHVLDQKQIDDVLAGKTIEFPAKSKAGKKYTARVKLDYTTGFKDKNKKWRLVMDFQTKKGKFKSKKKRK